MSKTKKFEDFELISEGYFCPDEATHYFRDDLDEPIEIAFGLNNKAWLSPATFYKKIIKPCPFCGCVGDVNRANFGEYFVACSNDNCEGSLGGGIWFTCKGKAIDIWNRRVDNA